MLRKPCSVSGGNTAGRTRVRASAKAPHYGRGLSAGLASLFAADAAMAIEGAVTSSGTADVISLLQDNSILTSAAAAVAVGSIAIAASLRPVRLASTGATDAWEALKAEERCVLVDIRPKSALKEEGVVDLKDANKKPLALVYAEPDEEGDQLVVDPEFASKLQQATSIGEESIIILLDSDGTLAPKAAEELVKDGFFKEKVYWVRGGMEGPKGWKESELPTKPYRVFELPLPTLELPTVDLAALAAEIQAQVPEVDLTGTVERVNEAVTVITDKYKENPSLANGVLAAAGVVAVGAFAITELDAILQVVGALGMARFLANNLLFAKDREATLASVRAFLKERGFDVPAAAAVSGGSAGSLGGNRGSAQMQQLADIVMGAKDADSAAQQIANKMVPEVAGVDQEALAAALAAAGFQLPLPPPASVPAAAAAAEAVLNVAAASSPAEVQAAPAALEPGPVTATVAAVEAPTTPPAAELRPAAATVAVAAAEVPIAAEAPAAPAVAEPVPVIAAAVVTATAEQAAVEPAALPVPVNVLEAREWIAAWKQRGILNAAAVEATVSTAAVVEPAAVAEASVAQLVPANVQEARDWIAAWKHRGSEAAAAAQAATVAASLATSPPVLAPEEGEVVVEVQKTEEANEEEEEEEEGVPEAGGSLMDDGVESALAPANVLAAREWITSWKQAARAQQQGAVVVAGDGASDSEPPTAPMEAEAAEVVEEPVTVGVVA